MERINRRSALGKIGLGLTVVTLAPTAVMSALADEAGVKKLRCPIYTWHEVDKDEFRSFVENLPVNCLPVALRDIGNYFYDGIQIWSDDQYPAVFTFDDTRLSQVENAQPILDQYRFRATFFVLQNYADGVYQYMDDGLIKFLADGGWETGVHGFTHRPLPTLRIQDRQAWENDIIGAKKRLEDLTGIPVSSFAYPYGRSNGVDEETRSKVAENYRIAVSTGGDAPNLRSDMLFELPRFSRS